MWDGYLAPGRRTLALASSDWYVLRPSDDATPDALTVGNAPYSDARFVEIASLLIRSRPAGQQNSLTVYGGATAPFNLGFGGGGTATFTQGSKTVTGSGTSFASGTAGAVIEPTISNGTKFAAVRSIASNTSLTLAEEWPHATASASSYEMMDSGGAVIPGLLASATDPLVYLGVAGSRLYVGQGNRIKFSGFAADASGISRPTPLVFATTDFHTLPAATVVVGLEPQGENLLVFTTSGIYVILNPAYDLTDDAGNQQQTVQIVSRDIMLWGDRGLGTSGDNVVVPALDELYLMGSDIRPITGGARKLYREYVRAGYRLGRAVVFRGHYFLPILPVSGTGDPVDCFVWRLDALGDVGAPFMRMGGHLAKSRAFVARSTDPSRTPKLLSAAADRIVDCTDCMQPSASVKQDADGTVHQVKVTTASNMTSESQQHTLRKARLRYELVDAATDNPTITVEYATGSPGSAFTSVSGSAAEGELVKTWYLAKKAQLTRLRFSSNGPAGRCVFREIEAHVRPDGRV